MTDWNPDEANEKSDGKPDKAIVPWVEALNNQGIQTFQSCSGHKHEDGTYSDGVLWIGPEAIDENQAQHLARTDEFTSVCRRYSREECWEVGFPGLAEGENQLSVAMECLFMILGLELPYELEQ